VCQTLVCVRTNGKEQKKTATPDPSRVLVVSRKLLLNRASLVLSLAGCIAALPSCHFHSINQPSNRHFLDNNPDRKTKERITHGGPSEPRAALPARHPRPGRAPRVPAFRLPSPAHPYTLAALQRGRPRRHPRGRGIARGGCCVVVDRCFPLRARARRPRVDVGRPRGVMAVSCSVAFWIGGVLAGELFVVVCFPLPSLKQFVSRLCDFAALRLSSVSLPFPWRR
jgi:hypothetical protein